MKNNTITRKPQEPIAAPYRGGKAKRILAIIVAVAFSIFFLASNQASAHAGSRPMDGSIVLIGDDDLLVDCNGETATIQWIKVYNSSSVLVLERKGCYANSCLYDVSSLSTGGFSVLVHTSQGDFSGGFEH